MHWIAASFIVSAELAVGAEDEPSLTVHLHDYADVPTATLIEAEHQASRIFQDAGIHIVWLHANMKSGQPPPAWASAAGPELLINVLSDKMNGNLGRRQATLGLALSEEAFPTYAYICFPCVTDSAIWYAEGCDSDRHWRGSIIFGSAMAHELGHLLGIRQHSVSGLMHAPWSVVELTTALEGHFRFFVEEKRKIRAHLQRRILFATHTNLESGPALAGLRAPAAK